MESLWTEVVSGWRVRASDLALNAPRCPQAPRSGAGGSVYVCGTQPVVYAARTASPCLSTARASASPAQFPLGIRTRVAWAL